MLCSRVDETLAATLQPNRWELALLAIAGLHQAEAPQFSYGTTSTCFPSTQGCVRLPLFHREHFTSRFITLLLLQCVL